MPYDGWTIRPRHGGEVHCHAEGGTVLLRVSATEEASVVLSTLEAIKLATAILSDVGLVEHSRAQDGEGG